MPHLRDTVKESIGNFLFHEGFQSHPRIADAILITIDEVSEYYEEGQLLFPEVFITNNIQLALLGIPHETVAIGSKTISSTSFRLAIKQCAPLCKDGWVIYINIDGDNMHYGLLSAELSSISLTLLELLKQQTDESDNSKPIAYIRRNTAYSVEVQGYKSNIIVDFSLKQSTEDDNSHTEGLCVNITRDTEEAATSGAKHYINKIISDALRNGHGNLIGVIDSTEDAIIKIKQELKGGVYLEKPIDLCELLKSLRLDNSAEADFKLRLYTSLIKSMINNDGITVFDTKSRLIGYHFIIQTTPPTQPSTTNETGTGTRSLAFEQMRESNLFAAGFFKSQDGKEKSF